LFSWNWTVLNEHKSQVVHFHQPPLDLRFLPGKSGRLHHVAWEINRMGFADVDVTIT
jgi:hypothetical protein